MKITKNEMHHVEKVWGDEFWVTNTDKYCLKILHINENSASSFHVHHLKDEHFYVITGKLKVVHGYSEESDAETTILEVGEAMHIPVGLRHRLIAHEGSVEFVEASTNHFDEDSIRLSPGY